MRNLFYIDVSGLITLEVGLVKDRHVQEIHKQYNAQKNCVYFVVSNDYLRLKLDAYGMDKVVTVDAKELSLL